MAIQKLFGKKKKLGFQEKPRTREEINQEYNNHASLHGHKSCCLEETRQHFEKAMNLAEQEINGHTVAMLKLRKEAALLPPETPITPDPVKEPETA